MIFTFKSKFQGFGSPETTMEFEADHITDVLRYFKQFLKGAGYEVNGELDFVSDEDVCYTEPGDCSFSYNDDTIQLSDINLNTMSYGAAQPIDFTFMTSDDSINLNLNDGECPYKGHTNK